MSDQPRSGCGSVKDLVCLIPQRFVVGIMSCCCVMVAYMLRVCLNISITQMVVERKRAESHNTNVCPEMSSGTNTTKHPGEYNWSEETQGIILGAFFYGYIVTHLPAALLAEKFGAKYILGYGILLTALLTLITPIVVQAGADDPTGIIIIRVVEGLGEGPTMPALATLMSRWVTRDERGVMGSLIFGGAQMGNILGTTIAGAILSKDGDWPLVFYVFGAIGVAWWILWNVLVYSDPRSHPFISDKERTFLEAEIEKKTEKSVPWKPLLSSMAIWAIVVAAVGHDWGYYTMITDLPKYMNDVLRFQIKNTGILSAIPYLIMWITSFIFGGICDFCMRRNYLSTKSARKIFTTIASIGPGIFIVGASYAGCDRTLAVVMFCIAMGFMGAYYCGMKVNCLDLTPNYSGTATALINGVGGISGIVTPYVVGYLTPNQTQEEWRVAFWIVFVVLTVTNIFYVIFAQGEEQWWNDIERNGYPESWKKSRET